MEKGENIITLEDLLHRFDDKKKKFMKELEQEERVERIETIDSIINDIKGQKNQTNIHKLTFINEIKSGLGSKIKENPTTVVKYNKPWYVKLLNWFKKLLTRF